MASLAVLADDDPSWRPSEFRQVLFGCETCLRFPTAKLLDFVAFETELEASSNPFSKVVLAHLKAIQTRYDPLARREWKSRLVRGLFELGLRADDIRELFRVIDWLMELPKSLSDLFWEDVRRIQKERQMPFISTPERVGEWRGLRKGIESVLRIRFGEDGLKLMPEINKLYGEAELLAILQALETAKTPDEVRPLFEDAK